MKKRFSILLAVLMACVLAFGATAAFAADNLPSADTNQRVGEGQSLPAWYPVSPSNFSFYHDENAPRVVDNADLLTDSQEQELEARILEIRRELERDIVVYTDNTSYGYSRDVWAADFYDFNGYGYGPEREGLCLFICMETGNRGFWTCATGSDTRSLFTESNANDLDDDLEYYIKRAVKGEGEYYDAVSNWVEEVYNLYTKGMPLVPEWLPDRSETYTRTHNTSALRIIDDAHVLTANQVIDLNARAKAISDKYGIDVVIHTSLTSYSMYMQDYSDNFYYYGGYGFGDNYDGILLTVFPDKYNDEPYVRMTVSGKAGNGLSETKYDRLLERYTDSFGSHDYNGAISAWLDALEHFEKTGRVPRSGGYWAFRSIIAAAAGAIFGGITLGSAKKKMRPVTQAMDANYYVVSNQMRVQSMGDNLLYTTTSRTYSPVERSSGSSGGGGRSSYSGSYHGSSGSSHSGSGRSF